MVAVRLLLAALLIEWSVVAGAIAADCTPCGVGALGPPRCIPNGGILVFNSVPPNVPAYWTLVADARGLDSLRRLDGRLDVWSDVVDPGVPGFPGELEGEVYWGASAQFAGSVRRDRVRAVATYPDGSECAFRLKVAFGFGGPVPNRFVCRDPAGTVSAGGRVDLQGIRLQGCRRERRPGS
jgi:hypothetical protein